MENLGPKVTNAKAPPSARPALARPKRSRGRNIVIAVVVGVAAVLIATSPILLSPSLSPLAFIRDTDGDGVPDSRDAFPNDSSESADRDSDGIGDNKDAFPNDPTQARDSDNDGYGDNLSGNNPDLFPYDSTEWADFDSDGFGDNSDFYNYGNAKIKIAVVEFYEYGCASDSWDDGTAGDPYFVISVDRTGDGVFEETQRSQTFTDTQSLYRPYYVVVDIPDNSYSVKFSIIVYDQDVGGYDVYDYCQESSGNYYVHTVSRPFEGSWSFDGVNDGVPGEIDCYLSYSISALLQ